MKKGFAESHFTKFAISIVSLSLLLALVVLPASSATAGTKNLTTNSLTRIGPNKNKPSIKTPINPIDFKIIQPKAGKTYRNEFPVEIKVPPSLPHNPTITLELFCRPLQKGQLKKGSFNPDITLLTMPLYARYKDRVLSTILARNVHYKIFHGKNAFSSSEFKLKATIRAGTTSVSKTTGWFRFLYDERSFRQEDSIRCNAPGIGTVNGQNSFRAPATVKVVVGHFWNAEIESQIQYTDCRFGNNYRTISLKPKISTKNEDTTILTFFIKQAGCYRVRARHRKTGAAATWSPWCKFTVTSGNVSTGKLIPSTKPFSPHTKMINPQPEPPGRPAMQPGNSGNIGRLNQ